MALYINGNFLNEPLTGVQQYATAMVRQIDSLLCGHGFAGFHEAVLLVPEGTECPFPLRRLKLEIVRFGRGNLWEQTALPYRSRGGLLLNLCNRAPLLKCRQFLVIHDAAVGATPERFSRRFRLFWRTCYRIFGRTLPAFATVSEFSRQELRTYFGIPEEKINVIYPGVEHLPGKEADSEFLGRLGIKGKSYLLAFGGTTNKNLRIIIRALPFLPSDLLLVVVGKCDEKTPPALRERIVQAGRVADEELIALYKSAACLVFPSLYEGFGLPPIEAMSLGCPVVAARRAALPEVCRDAALYCEAEDEKDVAAKIALLLCDDNLAESLRKRGLARAAEFSWEKAAALLSDAVQKLARPTNHNVSKN